MLKSLFGELATPGTEPAAPPESGFAALALLGSVDTQMNERGQMVDRHVHDLLVSGSAAQAMRDQFDAASADAPTPSRLLTLIDPTGIWAAAVIKALSDAGGQPIERLQLREQGTLRILAVVERTQLVRRHEDTLKIYRAEVRVGGPDTAEIPLALMERSHLTTVIIGSLLPSAIDALLLALQQATQMPGWRCPHLLFMLPPSSTGMGHKIEGLAWPAGLHVHLLSESMASASSVWNAMLGLWNQVKTDSEPMAPQETPYAATDAARDAAVEAADMRAGPPTEPFVLNMPYPQPRPMVMRSRPVPTLPARAEQVMKDALAFEGLLCCVVVDVTTGSVLACQARSELTLDIDAFAASSAQLLRVHRMAAAQLGLADPVDEIVTSAGSSQRMLRSRLSHPDLLLLALLDKQVGNLALTRYKLMEVEQALT